MRQEIQRHNAIDLRTALGRYNASEMQGGRAYRHRNYDPGQFCVYADNPESENWECVNCKRVISKKNTFGNKPIVMCNNVSKALATEPDKLVPVVQAPQEVGGVITRNNRMAPRFGVGFELKKVLRRIQIELPPTCICNSRAMMLNDIGIDEVLKISDKIMVWFEDEAHKRAIYFDHDKAKKILDIAVRRARKASLKQIKIDAENAKTDG
jgi:hypothetical protein